MNRKRISVILIVLLVGALLFFFKWPPVKPKAVESERQISPQLETPSAQAPAKQADTLPQGIVIPDVPGHKLSDQDKMNISKIVQVFSASIEFWGKVIDQHGNPVVGATVHYSAADKYFKDGTKYEGASDERGLFSISNIKGAGLYVRVSKDGYYHIDDKSAHSFGYGSPSGEAPPSKQQPAVFVLQKMGATEPLIKLGTGGVLVPKDGTPKKLSLRRERARLSGSTSGDLQIELWSDYQPPPPHGRVYDWRCRISVPGGGLVERVGDFNFEAPTENYIDAFEYKMSATNERWQPSMKKEFFLRLADGCYGRVTLNVISGGDVFVTLESYLNPVPGRRNLEFDPAKVIKPAP
jgi:hypothetical protein